MIKTLRVVSALTLGFLFTAALGLGGALLGIVFKIPCMALGRKNPFRYVINIWAFLVTEMCVKRLLSIETVITNTVPPIADDEVVVCFGNHPSTLGVATFTRFVLENLSSNILTVAKIEHLWNPFIGWPLWCSDSGIFVDRSSPKDSSDAIGSGIVGCLRDGSAIVIFPDMHRPSAKLIAEDRERFKEKISGLQNWPKQTLVPRGGGSFALTQAVKFRKVRAVQVTTFCNRADDTIWKLFNLFGAKFYIVAEEDFKILNLDRASLDLHQNAEWKKKNEMIEQGKVE
ncbi:MAG: 1-acyl-sn-glycerol-3-phosphate acyltransferase [Candidatus Vogelbacteria bacterium]|nr:1-acyl-sn-glycerol-3-phosphate acyltransferase [Candidatus Vogelbacteria bacterium]